MTEALSPYAGDTDEKLARRFLVGQVEVFAHLYERYYGRAYRLAYGMTGNHEAAEDLTQEVFIRTYQKLALFSEQSSFSTWFYRLAFNHCLNYCKSGRNRAGETTDKVEPIALNRELKQVEKNILQEQIQSQIHKALFSLKPKFRMIIILRDIEGLSYGEIAERMNCSVGTLGAQLKRARHLLAKKLEHLRGNF
jgi:RNA polymerase sigma-70 factor (ECF subfamily)